MFELIPRALAPFYIPLSSAESLRWNHSKSQTDSIAVYLSRVVLRANFSLNFDYGTDWNEWGNERLCDWGFILI